MFIERLPAGAVAAAILIAPGFHGSSRLDIADETTSAVSAPFTRAPSIKMLGGDIQAFALRQEYLDGSTAQSTRVSVHLLHDDQTPAAMVHEIRRISGLTWAQIAAVFGVSARAPYHWASGNAVSAEHHERLGQVVTTLRYIDRGSAEQNCNLLLDSARIGQTYLDLLRGGDYELVRELAGRGKGRPSFGSGLTEDAKKFNAPSHWGKDIELASGSDETEILPLNPPKVRRAKARRKKA
ncbi:hypothetical protein [Pseudooceanicola lipolyticus]|uniref:hypothetical protein n=1 Tax=Pseudooceanicola lipolyticus TaxID=2029104 RepID=UPI00105492BF|nr:hypothetical protein [Pseudooceanicola lipolyticus]